MDLLIFNDEFFDIINTKSKNWIFELFDKKTNNFFEIEEAKNFALIFKDKYIEVIDE